MHAATKPQMYPVCSQANLKGSRSAAPPSTVKFPAAYDINPDFKIHSLWDGKVAPADFKPPGPPVYGGGGGNGPVSKPPVAAGPSTSTGGGAASAVGQITSSVAGILTSSTGAAV